MPIADGVEGDAVLVGGDGEVGRLQAEQLAHRRALDGRAAELHGDDAACRRAHGRLEPGFGRAGYIRGGEGVRNRLTEIVRGDGDRVLVCAVGRAARADLALQIGDVLAPDVLRGLGARPADAVEHRRDGRAVVGQDLARGVLDRPLHAGIIAARGGLDRNIAVSCAVVVIVAQVGIRMHIGPPAGQLIHRIGARGDRLRADGLLGEVVRDLRGDHPGDIGLEREHGGRAVDLNRNGGVVDILGVCRGILRRGNRLGCAGLRLICGPEYGQQIQDEHQPAAGQQ